MSGIGLKNKLAKPKMKNVLILLVIALLVAGLAWGGQRFFKGDKGVNFKILGEGEIPKQIAGSIIPEYRQLERALSCLVDGKVYVIATRGEKPTSGYEIKIDRMTLEQESDGSVLKVFVKFLDPQPGLSLTQALTYPLQVAETELEKLPDQIQLKVQYVD